ncbi:MAG: FAD-binding oxidoreductase [Deltaproteobacteria bacterium]|nr:FAD-binding oxidoreductase [Deltaproteobacteria bacterium]
MSPTSRDSCRIGANIATNATGEDSFKYGPVRPYVEQLKILLADGSEQMLSRKDEARSWELGRAGLYLDSPNPIDLFIGSEGTLGFIAEATLSLLPAAPQYFSLLLPFPSVAAGLTFLIAIAKRETPFRPRALEFIDTAALSYMRRAPDFPDMHQDVKSLVYVKQEYATEAERLSTLEAWYHALLSVTPQRLMEWMLTAETEADQERFRKFRHHIPAFLNEEARQYWAQGGGKVGSDWWVPLHHLEDMLDFFYRQAADAGLFAMAYAHLGNGHPHTNLLPKNAPERATAERILEACCKRAVSRGGGLAGEHGVGKIHRNYLSLQHDHEHLIRMQRLKEAYDPNGLLGRGNIFGDQFIDIV